MTYLLSWGALLVSLVPFASPVEWTFGNKVALTDNYFSEAAHKIWIDTVHPLPTSNLTSFSYYIGSVPANDDLNGQTGYVRLQIWRLVSNNNYQLQYEQRIQLPQSTGEYRYPTDPQQSLGYRIRDYEYIGLTFEQDFGTICFEWDPASKTVFRDVQEGSQYPWLGGTYEFRSLGYPIRFSIAVKVDIARPGLIGDLFP